ncbi:hypothetical protein SPKIRA_16080 [Sphingomonas paucimobilis]|uniref:DNA, contig: SP604 n=1 Tax=Sphingomonas paucimobilis NBRC 13935 TaxID=1219050 RepID=A0A0C9MMR9_SPHPI|nr:hypothetical protein SPKIRA_16080 [Sphingomonas paucimobilis]GAN12081.1 hypothetical protein SP6_04_00050 [Sphingomonas paucimobilis NBRC 13935]
MIPTDAKERAFRLRSRQRQVRSVCPTMHSTVRREGDLGPKQTLGYDSGGKTTPALTKSKRPTPVFPVPADSLKACAYTQMRGVPQGVDAAFCWKGWNPASTGANPPPRSA